MRHLRPFLALLAIAAITVACSSSSSSPGGNAAEQSSGASSEASQPAQSTEASQPAQSTGGGGGGGANGSVHYEISGDYTASGDLPFTALGVSQFTGGGWVAFFGATAGDTVMQISTVPDALAAIFGNTDVSIPGSAGNGCTFDITKNDVSGLAGSFECQDAVGLRNAGTTQIHVDFSGEFEGHP